MRQPPEFPDIQITFDKGFLSQVITQRAISERLAQEKNASREIGTSRPIGQMTGCHEVPPPW